MSFTRQKKQRIGTSKGRRCTADPRSAVQALMITAQPIDFYHCS